MGNETSSMYARAFAGAAKRAGCWLLLVGVRILGDGDELEVLPVLEVQLNVCLKCLYLPMRATTVAENNTGKQL